MSVSEAQILKTLSKIKDPVSGRDIISAGLLADITIEGDQVGLVLMVDPAKADAYETVRLAATDKVASLKTVARANVILTAHKKAPEMQARPKRGGNPHALKPVDGPSGASDVTTIFAVASGKGGVGKSTVAVNLAVALTKLGHSAGVLDADVHGPSLPRLLGMSGTRASAGLSEKHERQMIRPIEAHGISAMSIGFLTDDDSPVVWRGPMVQGAIGKMLRDVDWGRLDFLVVDMPPGTGDAQLGLAQDVKPKGAIIVTTPQDLALADARKGAAMFDKVDIPVLGLIENMSVFVCPHCDEPTHLFGEDGGKHEAERLGVPLLGQAPLQLAIQQASEDGTPIAGGAGEAAGMFKAMAEKIAGLF